MSTATLPPVVATTPFLTIKQAADQLRTHPIHILRLIAIGQLRGIRAGQDRRDFKVTPEELARYVAAGSPGFEAVDLNTEDWFGLHPGLLGGTRQQYAGFDQQTIYGHYCQFCNDVRTMLLDEAPEVLPEGFDVRKTPTVTVKASAAIRQLAASAPDRPFTRIQGDPEPINRFGSKAGAYIAVELRSSVQNRLRNSQRRIDLGETQLTRLYASPESFSEIVAEAVESIGNGSIVARKTYPAPQPGDNPVTVNYRLPHSELGVDVAKVATLAF